jgi:AcrR family transcriptional regulator
MNQMPMKPLAGAQVRQPTRRALAKQATREKILASARDLFAEKGYEGATIRDIAAAAGMSTGAVFASFADKAELFQEILATRTETLVATMAEAGREGDVDKALLEMFTRGYELNFGDLPLLQAAVAVSWTPAQGPQLLKFGGRNRIVAVIEAVIVRGVQNGDLKQSTPTARVAVMLWDLFLASFRFAAFDAWSVEEMRKLTKEHIDVVLAGFRAK